MNDKDWDQFMADWAVEAKASQRLLMKQALDEMIEASSDLKDGKVGGIDRKPCDWWKHPRE